MRGNETESYISNEDCRKLCKNNPKCISFVTGNGTGIFAGCRYSEVKLNVSNFERTGIETDWVGLRDGNDINFIFILMNA